MPDARFKGTANVKSELEEYATTDMYFPDDNGSGSYVSERCGFS